MRNIWDNHFDYYFFRPYIFWAERTCYSKITVKGSENIPDASKASVFITPNHCNTLMDALMILQSRKEPTAFVARSDIFKNKLIATCLNNLKILPIYRHQDGVDATVMNEPIFDTIVSSVEHGTALCIFPEGRHRARRSILPFKKGVVRMAEKAAKHNPDRPVYIVPAAIEYADFFNLMMPVTLTYGKPIPVTGDEDLEILTDEIQNRVSSLFTCFPDDDKLEENEKNYVLSHSRRPDIQHYLLAFLTLPFFIASGFLCSPILLSTVIFSRKLKDKAWLNTVRFCCKQTLTPFLVAAALVAGITHLSWPLAIVLALLTLIAHPVFYRILIFYKMLIKGRLWRE